MSGKNSEKRVLCVCQGGNSRSVHLAYLLKYQYHLDALACGYDGNATETLWMLCNWADKVVVLEAYMVGHIPNEFKQKVSVYDVGPDRFFLPNYELLGILDQMIQKQMFGIDDKLQEEKHVDCR